MTEELVSLTAREAVARLIKKDISPLDLLDAAERRIARLRSGETSRIRTPTPSAHMAICPNTLP